MEKTKIQLAIEKCQNLLKFFTEKQSENYESVKIQDSDELVDYSEMKVGADVSVSSTAGSVIAPDGDYKLVNGAEFNVKDGKITTVAQEADAPAESQEQVPTEKEKLAAEEDNEDAGETQTDEQTGDNNADVEELQGRVSQLEEMVKSMMEVINLVPSKEDVEDFKSKIEILSKVPTQLSADNRVEIKETELEKYKRIAEMYSK